MPLSIELCNAPAQSGRPALAHLAFGGGGPGAIVHRGLQPLTGETVHEFWRTDAPAVSGCDGAVSWCANEQLLFGSVAVSIANDTAGATYDLYRKILDCAEARGAGHLLRVWHYLPRINHGAGDAESYKRFCLGRAKAFDERLDARTHLPAGTTIGTRAGDELLIYFLATPAPAQQIENPRQVSAFEYPRRYGPRAPQFSRAVVWSQGGDARLLVSGTASIVGHQSMHRGDLQGQLNETWRNLECLRERAGATRPLALRIYVRREGDYPAVRDFMAARLDTKVAALYLLADICRSELLVEIEGVYDIPRGTDSRLGAAPAGAGRAW